jgi:AAA15 family ATPase/GTPase
MAQQITHINISNFKSIKKCEIKDCKRINLFIGRPNVGKSNILEALSLFSVPYLLLNKSKNLNNLVRAESVTELFYSGNYEESAYVQTNRESATLVLDKLSSLEIKLTSINMDMPLHYDFDDNLNLRKKERRPFFFSSIKKYRFAGQQYEGKAPVGILLPPFGDNLYSVLDRHPELKKEVGELFKEYQLELVFDRASRSLKILKQSTNSIFLVPYHSIADTLQRIIFFKTAIAGNEDSVLLFEEPEAHSFPPYITQITQEMIHNRSNQYFLATHSPFILNDLLENAIDDLSVYMVDYKDHETKVKRLTAELLHKIYQSGVDLFTNSETFV